MPQWTEDQQKVIDSTSEKLVCSAAAGSGKTAVMIERIVRLIRDGADPFSFLVITFTNAAAAEMKEKIRKRLSEERSDGRIAAAAEKAGAMEVCTIHAFCQHLIRQEFQIVGVDPFFQICTGAQREQLFEKAFRQACNELKKRDDPDYRSFIRQYDPEEAKQIVMDVWQFIMSLPDPFGWLEDKTEDVPVSLDRTHPWFRTVARMMDEKILTMQVLIRHQLEMFDEYEKLDAYREVWKADRQIVEALERWKNSEPVREEELTGEFMRVPSLRNLNSLEIDWKDRYQELRSQLKEQVGAVLSWMRADEQQMAKEFAGIRDSLRGLRKITEETQNAFEKSKARVRALDFTDLEHKAYRILTDPDGRTSVRSRYKHIFVDECQDISSIQNALIDALAEDGNTLFMVGDVKQSIYRFRLANPKLFQARIGAKGPEADECIFLRENFRSRPEILETSNTIFRDVMRKSAADIDYTPDDELKPGRKDCAGDVPVNVDLLEQGEGLSKLETAAAHTAERILELVGTKQFRFRDIVILMPEVSTDGPKLTDMLKKQGIPVFFDGRGGFYEQPEVEAFRNLLMHLDNPRLDLPLLTVLVNPPFSFTEEELSLIRLKDMGRGVPFWQAFDKMAEENSVLGAKCRAAKEKTEDWRFQAARTRLKDFLWYLLEDSGIYAVFGAKYNGRAAQKNLRSFCLQAERAAEQGICVMREFLDFLSEQASGGEMQAASSLGNEDDLVRIMTMHKSKGLQFPVVFCLGLEKGLKGKPGDRVRLDEDLGICLRYKVPEWRLARRTAADEIFEWKKNHDVKAERICLLYVAVTRAQEKLFLVGTETNRTLWGMPSGDHRTAAAEDYLDCVMPALQDAEKESTTCTQGPKPWKITIYDNIKQKSVDNKEVIHNLEPWVETLLSAPPVDDLWKTDPDGNTPEKEENILKKYSVTALLQNARNRVFLEDDEQTPEEKRTPDYVERAMKRYRAGNRPAFMQPAKEADGAARGTAVHRFLSLVDLDAVRQAGGADSEMLAAMRDRLVEQQVFTEEEGSWIRPEVAAAFFSSDIGRRMLASPEVHREWDFNLCRRDRNMILQGMIDCAFREGDGWILLDYKTDRIRNEEDFTEEYRPQLEWYAAALRELTGKPVKESWLYALSVDKAIRVDRPAEGKN
ncbi:MAG: UvrD-helicase domain-containing protein [Clostridiales bacterium]|nr:UvrD-helicase domain-containing protein [Clostridiales bacterium]